MTKRKKSAFEKSKPREIDWSKYPRSLDTNHGFKMVEDLFDNLTPEGWAAPVIRDPAKDQEND